MIQINKPPKERFFLDITPLINVVFLLQIFFLLTSTMAPTALKVDLPEAESAEKMNAQELTVAVGRDGTLMLGKDPVALEQLADKLKAGLADRRKKTVQIQADREVEYDLFAQVLDQARNAGAQTFLIATDHPEPDADDLPPGGRG